MKKVASNINTATLLGQERKTVLDSLLFTIEKNERHVRFELMNNIDQKLNDNIPTLQLLDLTSHIEVAQRNSTYEEYYKGMSVYMTSLLENCSPIASNTIQRLFAYSLLNKNNKQTDSIEKLSRKYLCTDQSNIYVLHIIAYCYLFPRPDLFPSLNNVYCIVTSKATVNLKAIDFQSLALYYQRQLTSCRINKQALNHLYHDFKHTYYKLIDPKGITHERWEL